MKKSTHSIGNSSKPRSISCFGHKLSELLRFLLTKRERERERQTDRKEGTHAHTHTHTHTHTRTHAQAKEKLKQKQSRKINQSTSKTGVNEPFFPG